MDRNLALLNLASFVAGNAFLEVLFARVSSDSDKSAFTLVYVSCSPCGDLVLPPAGGVTRFFGTGMSLATS